MTGRTGRHRGSSLSRYTAIFKALSDETRLRIYILLGRGELCVCHIQAALGTTQTKVSRHLGVLRNAGLVTARREGLWIYYRRSDPGPPAIRFFTRDLARLLDKDPDLGTPVGREGQCECEEEVVSHEKETHH
ncbi:MAG: metalloregulator ArsR/SmtB family transcription factor [Methanolinea sp.]|nr:metalloregulator ArsR/SmtB family transcription factor [Methanolinea sp.]